MLAPGPAPLRLPSRPPPADVAEARRQDLADLRILPSVDRSFSPEARTKFLHEIDRLSGETDRLSPAGFAMAVSRLVALAGNAHTSIDLAQRADSFNRAPLRFAWFADGLHIVRATEPFAGLLGRRVLSIDGRSVEAALAAIAPYFSGTAERAKAESPPLLESPALLQALWPETDGVHLSITTETDSGDADDSVAALPPRFDPFSGRPILTISAAPEAEDERWRGVLSAAPKLPLSLEEPFRVALSAPLDKGGIYVRINANRDDDHGPLARQLADVAALRPVGGWRFMVLDLRFNDGGDEFATMAFSRAVPDLLAPGGKAWVLVGNATFSAAIIVTARVRYFLGPARTRIVGERVGDHDRFWVTGGASLVLRNSDIAIGHAYFAHDWVHGCWSIADCDPAQFIYGVAAGDLSPDITLGWNFTDYAQGRDTVLDRVLELANQPRQVTRQ